jgi:cell division protein FtsW (lipid II flippase)
MEPVVFVVILSVFLTVLVPDYAATIQYSVFVMLLRVFATVRVSRLVRAVLDAICDGNEPC